MAEEGGGEFEHLTVSKRFLSPFSYGTRLGHIYVLVIHVIRFGNFLSHKLYLNLSPKSILNLRARFIGSVGFVVLFLPSASLGYSHECL